MPTRLYAGILDSNILGTAVAFMYTDRNDKLFPRLEPRARKLITASEDFILHEALLLSLRTKKYLREGDALTRTFLPAIGLPY